MKYLLILNLLILFVFSGSAAVGAERYVVPLKEEINLTNADKVFHVDGFRVAVSMTRPPREFKPINFKITFLESGKKAEIDKAYIKFNMSMDMGPYKAKLKDKGEFYAGRVILPKCMFGGYVWFAKLVFVSGGQEHVKIFFLDMRG